MSQHFEGNANRARREDQEEKDDIQVPRPQRNPRVLFGLLWHLQVSHQVHIFKVNFLILIFICLFIYYFGTKYWNYNFVWLFLYICVFYFVYELNKCQDSYISHKTWILNKRVAIWAKCLESDPVSVFFLSKVIRWHHYWNCFIIYEKKLPEFVLAVIHTHLFIMQHVLSSERLPLWCSSNPTMLTNSRTSYHVKLVLLYKPYDLWGSLYRFWTECSN